jgi:predicted ester cyclase
MTTTEQNKAIARRYFDMWNARNPALADEFVAADVAGHIAGKAFSGIAVLKERINSLSSIYSNPGFTVEDLFGEGDRIAVRWTLRGAHTGEYMGAKPTGKQVTATGINIFRIAGGKVAEIWVESDDLGELQQLGVISRLGQG